MRTRTPISARSTVQSDTDKLLKRALREPGVVQLVQIYEQAEAAYAAVTTSLLPQEITASSANNAPGIGS